MNILATTLYLLAVWAVSWGLSIGLTWAPCYASLCSEEFYAFDTRLHIITYYALIASIVVALLVRAYSPICRTFSEHSLLKRRGSLLPRVSIGGLTFACWVVGITLVTTVFWVTPLIDFWGAKFSPFGWDDAQIQLVVTGIIGHHADILLGLILIPVGRNSILGRAFTLHQHTLLYAHKLIAYLAVFAAFAHGVAYYFFVGFYASVADSDPRKDAFNIDNPTLSIQETEIRGSYHSATLGTGMISFLFMLVIVVTALPVLRRKAYNVFYALHIILSSLIFIGASLHASTNFYFLLPGLLLWTSDWAWRLFRGDTGLRKTVDGILEDAGNGWYRIRLPLSAACDGSSQDEPSIEKQLSDVHPLQTYYLNLPSVSKWQNHAFTAAQTGSAMSGPVFLFQRATRASKRKQEKYQTKEWTWKVGGQALPVERAKGEIVLVRAEGPYIPADCDYRTASKIICIVGGTGITGALSLANWFLAYRSRNANARFALIWTVRSSQTAQLAEWQELVARSSNCTNMTVRLHVSSESGRLNVDEALKRELTAESNISEDQDLGGRSAWVYVSGPAGMLSVAEDACVEIKSTIRKARKKGVDSGFGVQRFSHYVAHWEV